MLQYELFAWLGVRVIAFESNGKEWTDARARDDDSVMYAATSYVPLKRMIGER